MSMPVNESSLALASSFSVWDPLKSKHKNENNVCTLKFEKFWKLRKHWVSCFARIFDTLSNYTSFLSLCVSMATKKALSQDSLEKLTSMGSLSDDCVFGDFD
ncbi:hypothetical protein CEXT_667951 [Caerostris extrusa]|uniref:Uncharacterized protein n=1 Tax=Caerostris extrusa TaxID=172846 RepID=A0AAV4XTV9_CAEEX|nr:hypothetical protein CEXT_667951 [Caerostris extrusa]